MRIGLKFGLKFGWVVAAFCCVPSWGAAKSDEKPAKSKTARPATVRPPRPPKPVRPPRPARPVRSARPSKRPLNISSSNYNAKQSSSKKNQEWLSDRQKQRLLESSISAPRPSGLLFSCKDYCDPFATVWLASRSASSDLEMQRLRGKKIPRPRPPQEDPSLVLVPATEISIDSWRAITGTPHPEPGNGMMLAQTDVEVKKDFEDEVEKEIKPRALWIEIGGSREKRSTSGSGFYQDGFDNSSVLAFQGEACILWQVTSRYGYCLGGQRSLGEGLGRYEQEAYLSFRWARRSRALKRRGIEFRGGFEYLSYSPPTDIALNASATTLGVRVDFGSVLAETSAWWEPSIHLNFSYSLKGTDADQLRGETLKAIAFESSLDWRVQTALLFKIYSADHRLSVVPKVSWSNRWDFPQGSARNPFFPSNDKLTINHFKMMLAIQLEEQSW